jgi:hypothetical protein
MTAEKPEAVGFACRWGLLALVLGVACATGVSGFLAAAELVSRRRARLVKGDEVVGTEPSRAAYLNVRGYPVPVGGLRRDASYAVGGVVGRDFTLARTGPGRLAFYLPMDLPAGEHAMRVEGIPYCRLAFTAAESRLFRVGPRRRVVFFDARLASPDDRSAWAAFLRAFGAAERGGLAVACVIGPVGEYLTFAGEARATGFAGPIVHSEDAEGPARAVRHLIDQLYRGAENRATVVVTPDPSVIGLALGRGARVELIGDHPERRGRHDRLRVHRSLTALAEAFGQSPEDRYNEPAWTPRHDSRP